MIPANIGYGQILHEAFLLPMTYGGGDQLASSRKKGQSGPLSFPTAPPLVLLPSI